MKKVLRNPQLSGKSASNGADQGGKNVTMSLRGRRKKKVSGKHRWDDKRNHLAGVFGEQKVEGKAKPRWLAKKNMGRVLEGELPWWHRKRTKAAGKGFGGRKKAWAREMPEPAKEGGKKENTNIFSPQGEGWGEVRSEKEKGNLSEEKRGGEKKKGGIEWCPIGGGWGKKRGFRRAPVPRQTATALLPREILGGRGGGSGLIVLETRKVERQKFAGKKGTLVPVGKGWQAEKEAKNRGTIRMERTKKEEKAEEEGGRKGR